MIVEDLVVEVDFDFDQRHNFSMVLGYVLSETWRIGAKFQYASGMPYTPVTGSQQINGRWYIVEGEKNSARLPDFHQLDIRLDRQFYFDSWSLSMYLDLWNVYDKKNVVYYFYDVDNFGRVNKQASTDFSIMPIFGLSAQF